MNALTLFFNEKRTMSVCYHPLLDFCRVSTIVVYPFCQTPTHTNSSILDA